MAEGDTEEIVEDYLCLGLALGRHVEGLVDAYYGPLELAASVTSGPPEAPGALADKARRLLAALGADSSLDPHRRRWIQAQARGLHATARKLAGEELGYLDEVEACYGVRPALVPEDDFAAGHARLTGLLPGSGPLAARYTDWREKQVVAPGLLESAVASLAEDLRARTAATFGLPEGERVDFETVTDRPWAGFNYYLGGLRSRVAINLDLPVLSLHLGHLVAHEAYPGHHTEHCRKEVGLVQRHHQLEESIFLVGTPQCLLAEGLADLGLEVVAGRRPEPVVASHLRPLGIPYDGDLIGPVSEASEALAAVRSNAAILLHEHGRPPDEVVGYVMRWQLTSKERAEQAVRFMTDPTWRAYVFCYTEGLRLCREFVQGEAARFARLISEQLVPEDLAPPTPSVP